MLSPVCTSETEDLEDVISDEENKMEESRHHAVTLQMVCKEIGNQLWFINFYLFYQLLAYLWGSTCGKFWIFHCVSIVAEITYSVADLRRCRGRGPPRGPDSFHIMNILRNFVKMVSWRLLGIWRPLLGEILDLPLVLYLNAFFFQGFNFLLEHC